MNISALHERGFFDKLTGNDIVIGYRFVDQNQALTEYNRHETLRAIPATDEEKELLEGAYLSPSLDLRPDGLPSNYWENALLIANLWNFHKCKMTANDKLLMKRPMLFISDVEKVKRNKEAIVSYISAHGISSADVSKTILFWEHRYSGGKVGYQMLIPSMYLEKSYYYSERKSGWGTNSLGIRAWCMQFGYQSGAPAAEWKEWKVSGWPKGSSDNTRIVHHAQSTTTKTDG
ncbi:hypothetical protein J3R30DRAFT_3399757 [Lentinula aciculospora]|uniref:Uncharacterized protein n=1 Tax=Lentinula aciculospora TaxID=153920 RepID=A0A9W9DWZ9_9AGAR|nr:hypothetical protein J3R30DRAFT_3399757 [Lentinula aciculospora]